MNDLIRPALYDSHHEIVPVREPAPGAARIKYDVVGPVCETSDLFAADRALPELKSGDLVAILIGRRLWRGDGVVLQCPPARAGGLGQGRRNGALLGPDRPMTSSSPRTVSPTGWRTDARVRADARLKHAHRAGARFVLVVERVMPALWPAIGFIGLYLAAALFGAVRASFPGCCNRCLLAAAITATGLALENGFADFRWPNWQDAARRLERDSGLRHRPISEGDDRLMAGGGDPVALELWARHQARALPDRLRDRLAQSRFRFPRSAPAASDPAGAAGGQPDRGAGRMAGAADRRLRQRRRRRRQPGCLGRSAALYRHGADLSACGRAPASSPCRAGSILNLRAHGASPCAGRGDRRSCNPPRFTGEDGEYAATARLTHDGACPGAGQRPSHRRLESASHSRPRCPVIAFTAPPSVTEREAVKFAFKASDDYGVTSARVVIRPHGKPGAPLIVDLPLAPAKTMDQTSYADLTGHPYAGLMVDAHLEARDGAGQIGASRTVTFRLPARVFTDPLARALIEQRQELATSDGPRRPPRRGRDAERADHRAGQILCRQAGRLYRHPRRLLGRARRTRKAIIDHVEDLLWQIAMALEQKGMLAAADSLRELQALITAAMAAHAPAGGDRPAAAALQPGDAALHAGAGAELARRRQQQASQRSQRQDHRSQRSAEDDEGDPATVRQRQSRAGGADAGGAAEHAGEYAHVARAQAATAGSSSRTANSTRRSRNMAT